MPEFSVFFVPILVYFSTFRPPPPPFSKGSKFQINEKHKCLVFSHFLFAFWYISRHFSHVFQGLKKKSPMPGFLAFFVPILVYFSAFSPVFQGFKISNKLEAQMPVFSADLVVVKYKLDYRPKKSEKWLIL